MWKVSKKCQEGILKGAGSDLKSIWKVSECCPEGVWKVSGKCFEVSWRHLKGIKLGQVKTEQVKPGQIKSGRHLEGIKFGRSKDRTGQVGSAWNCRRVWRIRVDQSKSCNWVVDMLMLLLCTQLHHRRRPKESPRHTFHWVWWVQCLLTLACVELICNHVVLYTHALISLNDCCRNGFEIHT